ncbi:hypothetical protein LTR85_012144 [Meristemomyces frigidus]|nr:hypothetical protein LTR85_012144 [Meristemomyces frigidus]
MHLVYDMKWRDRAERVTHGGAVEYGIVELPDAIPSLDVFPKPRGQYSSTTRVLADLPNKLLLLSGNLCRWCIWHVRDISDRLREAGKRGEFAWA